MWTKLPRLLIALCGILGSVALGIYFSVPFPLPPANATTAQINQFATQYHDAILFDAWLQAVGSLLTVVFAVALVHLAGASNRLAGKLTLLVATIVLGLGLTDATFTIGAVQASANGHFESAVACYDLTNVFVHVFLIAPSLFLVMGAALLGTPLLPRWFSYLALADGIAFQVLGFIGLFNSIAVSLVILLLIAQVLWTVAAAVILLIDAAKVAPTPAMMATSRAG